MNRMVNHHVSNHQVKVKDRGAVFVFYPEGLRHMDHNFMQSVVKRSLDAYADNFSEDSQVFFNSWATTSASLLPALASLPRHFKENKHCYLHVFFVCHGIPGNVIWARNKRISVKDILTTLQGIDFQQLQSVVFLSCNSLKDIENIGYPFDVVGFCNYVYWNEMPFFLARMVKELSFGESVKKAAKMAVKTCDSNSKTPLKWKDVRILPSTK